MKHPDITIAMIVDDIDSYIRQAVRTGDPRDPGRAYLEWMAMCFALSSISPGACRTINIYATCMASPHAYPMGGGAGALASRLRSIRRQMCGPNVLRARERLISNMQRGAHGIDVIRRFARAPQAARPAVA